MLQTFLFHYIVSSKLLCVSAWGQKFDFVVQRRNGMKVFFCEQQKVSVHTKICHHMWKLQHITLTKRFCIAHKKSQRISVKRECRWSTTCWKLENETDTHTHTHQYRERTFRHTTSVCDWCIFSYCDLMYWCCPAENFKIAMNVMITIQNLDNLWKSHSCLLIVNYPANYLGIRDNMWAFSICISCIFIDPGIHHEHKVIQ